MAFHLRYECYAHRETDEFYVAKIRYTWSVPNKNQGDVILGVYGPIKDTDDYKDFSDLIKPEKVNWFMANKNKFTKVSLSVVFSWLREAEKKRNKQERRKKLSQLNSLEWSELYPMTIDNCYNASFGGGVYSLVRKSGSTYEVFYIGQSKTIVTRLLNHMGQGSGFFKRNPCVKEHLEKYDCYFRFVIIEHWATRNKIERQLIDKYNPTCNRVTGITKRPKKTMTNTIRSFLNKQPVSWGPLESDSEKLFFYPDLVGASVRRKTFVPIVVPDWLTATEDKEDEEVMPSVIVIGEWDGEILIMPDIDEKLTNQNIKRFREKLRAMAIRQGIKIRRN